VAEPDWYRAPTWNAAASDTFEQRLRRARAGNRPQYLRIQAVTLLESADPNDRQAAIALLHRLLDQYPENFEVPFAHELLAEAYRADGDLDRAEQHLRRCLATAPANRSGTSHLADLTLAEVLVERDDPARLAEATALLAAADLPARLVFHAQAFRYYLVRARLADRVGDPRRQEYAQHALQVAAITTPQLPRHPTVGLVHADAAVLAELRQLATA
jgi:cytochrome c-type biogenesis protein CcmH/NrfG